MAIRLVKFGEKRPCYGREAANFGDVRGYGSVSHGLRTVGGNFLPGRPNSQRTLSVATESEEAKKQ